jgi:hypothetical protein
MGDRDRAQRSLKFRVAGENNAQQARVFFEDSFQERGPVHPRHAHVGDDDVEGGGLEHREGCFAPPGTKDMSHSVRMGRSMR